MCVLVIVCILHFVRISHLCFVEIFEIFSLLLLLIFFVSTLPSHSLLSPHSHSLLFPFPPPSFPSPYNDHSLHMEMIEIIYPSAFELQMLYSLQRML